MNLPAAPSAAPRVLLACANPHRVTAVRAALLAAQPRAQLLVAETTLHALRALVFSASAAPPQLAIVDAALPDGAVAVLLRQAGRLEPPVAVLVFDDLARPTASAHPWSALPALLRAWAGPAPD